MSNDAIQPIHSFAFGSTGPEPGSVPVSPKRAQADLAGGMPQPSPEDRAAVMARRQAAWAEAQAKAPAGDPDDADVEQAPAPANQRPRAIDCVLASTGVRVVYGPPVSNLSLVVAGILGVEDSRHFVKQMLARTEVCVQQVGDKAYKQPTTWVQCAKVADILGEAAVDELMLLHDKYWPSIKKEDLPNVRLIF